MAIHNQKHVEEAASGHDVYVKSEPEGSDLQLEEHGKVMNLSQTAQDKISGKCFKKLLDKFG